MSENLPLIETHKRFFRGVWLRPEVMQKIEEGELSSIEAILLMVIDSLCNPDGEDCYASNEYLAAKIGVQERQLRRMLSHLKEIGFLEQTGFNGRKRYLAPSYSNGREKTGQTGLKRPFCPVLNDRSDLLGKKFSSKSHSSPQAVKGDIGASSSHPMWSKWAQNFHTAISKSRRVNSRCNTSSWAESLFKIHALDGHPIERIRKVLQWYCQELRRGDLIKENSDFIPVAHTGKTFRTKFDAIEAAMIRLERKRAIKRQEQGLESPARRYKAKDADTGETIWINEDGERVE